ncbi:unnamed protein product [Vicia faba]|uniref:Uncharacterized protein n=1 Tax=Vicia faba TaxID=3906 RepID=A0AAV0YSL4_VICFA|nr:unnamed protein product [Vicia faba]
MVVTHQGSYFSGKEKTNVKKVKKSSRDDKVVFNVYGVKLKGIVISRMVDGQVIGSSPIKRPKEVKKMKLKKLNDHTPITMSDLIRKGVETAMKVSKNTKESFNPRENVST